MDRVNAYILPHLDKLMDAAQAGYDKYGRGVLSVMADTDNGKGKASVVYYPAAHLQEDEDPAFEYTQAYNPPDEAILMVLLTKSHSIHILKISRFFVIPLEDQTETGVKIYEAEGVK